jgi:D-alanyl-D-alanine carboxypeptidase
MTCYLTILISKKYELDLKDLYYRVPDSIAGTPGTSAQLEAGDILTAYDLLFALMLPSGNDAALCLADVMGKAIQRHRKK